ncbi:Retrovirus-related Pol polyprotein from transposon 412 [Aduncisulcus paluster]|uniref:Retrovirus-related Pol polyprotein from transposon 412 n=1 Tax=Aduncisulcus paluster TaxID=2918883 RepID=A0ABQ5KTV6_9EUKA|nr:Retrovirus-related Pol polyprotein from transposon 412 [Aduncisulcus paluster]
MADSPQKTTLIRYFHNKQLNKYLPQIERECLDGLLELRNSWGGPALRIYSPAWKDEAYTCACQRADYARHCEELGEKRVEVAYGKRRAASPKASVNVIGVNKDRSPVKREEPSLKRMVPLEREVLQQEAEMWASPSPEHGPHIQEDDVQTMKDKETNQMDNIMLIDGVLEQTEWQGRSSGTGVTAEKWPIECLTGEQPFNARKPDMVSNWYPGIPSCEVVYHELEPDGGAYDFDKKVVAENAKVLSEKPVVHCMAMSSGDDKDSGVVTVRVTILSSGSSKQVKCLFDTGSDISLISESWLRKVGYRVDGSKDGIPAGKAARLFDNAVVKADKPLVITVFGGGQVKATHYIVLKTRIMRGEGRNKNQYTTFCGYITYWLSSWLGREIPLIIGRDGMSVMKLNLDVIDMRAWRTSSDHTKEIESVLKQLTDKVKSGDMVETDDQSKDDKVMDLGDDPRVQATFQVMGDDIAEKVDDVVREMETVTVNDIKKFGSSVARVNETKCYLRLIVAMLKSVDGLFGGLDSCPANVGKFRIDLTSPDVVVSEPFRRIRRDWAQEIYQQLLEMERKKVIRPSTNEYHCATVIVPKKNGKLRLCVDYRPLNKVTKGMGQVLPVIDDLFQLLGGTKYYAVLDLTSGYWQIEVEESSKKFTSFVTQFGQYEFNRLPFGLKNAPPFFQECMNRVLTGLIGMVCCVYLDDIIVFSDTMMGLLVSLLAVLIRLEQFNLKVNLEKTIIGAKEVEFLGFMISEDGIRRSPKKLEALKKFKRLRNVSDVRSFLGTANYLKKFIPKYAEKVKPLTAMVGKHGVFKWTDEVKKAISVVTQDLENGLCLEFPRPDAELHLYTDASLCGIGGVLVQFDPKDIKRENPGIVEFLSRTLSAQEQNQTTTEREALAVFFCICKCEFHLRGRKFWVHTDHKNLKWIQNTKSAKVERWRTYLSDFEFELEYITGAKNVVADALSRIGHLPKPLKPGEKVKALSNDEADAEILKWRPEHVEARATPLVGEYPDIEVRDSMITRKAGEDFTPVVVTYLKAGEQLLSPGAHDSDEKWIEKIRKSQRKYMSSVVFKDKDDDFLAEVDGKLVIPDNDHELVTEIMTAVHDDPLAGHVGISKMLEGIRNNGIYIRNAHIYAKEHVDKCLICQRLRARLLVRRMMKSTSNSQPFDTVAVDTVGPIMVSNSGNRYLVVMVDMFTRWTEIVPTQTKEAVDAAQALIDGIFGRFGLPRVIQSDRGGEYVNGVIRELYTRLGITQHKVLAARPQANGMVERANQEVIRHIRIALAMIGYKDDWEHAIPMAQYVINTTKNRMTGVSPYEALFGQIHKPTRGSLLKWKDKEGKSDVDIDDIGDDELMNEYVKLLKQDVSLIHSVMKKANEEATLKRDKKIAPAVDAFNKQVEKRLIHGVQIERLGADDGPARTRLVYTPGSFVMLKPRTKVSHKFSSRLIGPWLVEKHNVETETLTLRNINDDSVTKVAADVVVPFDDSHATWEEMKAAATMDKEDYIVEEILSHTRNSGGRFAEKDRYLFEVKWLGYDKTDMQPWNNLVGNTSFVQYCKKDKKLKALFLDKKKGRNTRGRKKKDWQEEESEETSDESYRG